MGIFIYLPAWTHSSHCFFEWDLSVYYFIIFYSTYLSCIAWNFDRMISRFRYFCLMTPIRSLKTSGSNALNNVFSVLNYSKCPSYCFGIISCVKKKSLKLHDSNTKEGFPPIFWSTISRSLVCSKRSLCLLCLGCLLWGSSSHKTDEVLSYPSLLIKTYYLCLRTTDSSYTPSGPKYIPHISGLLQISKCFPFV